MPPSSVPLDAIRQPAFVYAAEGRIVAANSPIQALAGRSLAGCTAANILATFRNRHPDGTPFLPHHLPCPALFATRRRSTSP